MADTLPDLAAFDRIMISSSAGKDSQAMLDRVVELADAAGVPRGHLVVVHADLGDMEWPGVVDLVREHAEHYGLRLVVQKAVNGDLLDRVRRRGKWPSPAMRWCTSDLKRGPCARTLTTLAREVRESGVRRPVRILSCMGMRAEESNGRAKLEPYARDDRQTNGRRQVWRWLPIHDWKVGEVWDRIRAAGTRHHPAYDLGMPRLSCRFCIFAPRSALLLAGEHNRELLDCYVDVEREVGHRFRQDLSLEEVRQALRDGERAGAVRDWEM